MVEVKKEGIILSHTDLVFENEAVFNPAIFQDGNKVHMFYRAVRIGNYSTIGYCLLDGPLEITHRDTKPVLIPEFDYEYQGVEDPRIVKIEDIYYLTYTAYDCNNALGALATSNDLLTFQKQGLIAPKITFRDFKHLSECCSNLNKKYYRDYEYYYERGALDKNLVMWDKNIIFFPRKINGKLAFLHRIRPGIQLVTVDSLEDLTRKFWEDYFMSLDQQIVLNPKYNYEASYIGGGCPPIETEDGWLLIYHCVQDTPEGYIYQASAALLDLEDPRIEISRLKDPLFVPELEWERFGVVNNVVFPTGTSLFDDRLFIYYGAADKCIAVASVNIKELLTELKNK